MPDSPITKREAIGGGVLAAVLTAAIPVIQLWAEGQRREAGDKAAGAEIVWFTPIIQQQFEHSQRLEQQIRELEKNLWLCQPGSR